VWSARVLGLHDKPVVVLDTDGLFAPLREQVELMVTRGFVRRQAADVLQWAASVGEAMDLVEAGIAHPVRMVPTVGEELEGEA
jgi:predicted Rossmann-fold nucleotide-binding protein